MQFISLFSSALITTFTTGSSVHDIAFSISVIFNRSDTLLSLLVIFVFLTKCPVIIFKNVSSASVSVICLPILKIFFSQLFLVVFMSSILSSVRINSVLWLIKLYFWILASCELKTKFSQSSTVLIGWDFFSFIFDKLFSLFNDLRIITFSLFAFSESLSSLLQACAIKKLFILTSSSSFKLISVSMSLLYENPSWFVVTVIWKLLLYLRTELSWLLNFAVLLTFLHLIEWLK